MASGLMFLQQARSAEGGDWNEGYERGYEAKSTGPGERKARSSHMRSESGKRGV